MQCELDIETRDSLSRLAYEHWAEAYDTVKRLEKEENDGSPDWQLFHAAQLKTAKDAEVAALRVRDAIGKYSPLIIGD